MVTEITVKHLTFIWFITLAPLKKFWFWKRLFQVGLVFRPKTTLRNRPERPQWKLKNEIFQVDLENGVGNNGSRFVSERDYFTDIVCDSWFTVLVGLFFERYSFSTSTAIVWLNFSRKLFERLPLKGTKIAFLKIFQLGEASMCLSLTWNLWTIPRVGENIDPKSMSSSSPRFSSLHV